MVDIEVKMLLSLFLLKLLSTQNWKDYESACNNPLFRIFCISSTSWQSALAYEREAAFSRQLPAGLLYTSLYQARLLYVYPAAYPASLYQAAYPNPVPQVHIQPALALKQDHKTPCVGKYQIGILGPVKIRVFFDLPLWRWMFWAKWLNKNIFLSNKNRDYDMQVKLQIYEGGSELERDHTGNGYQPDKNENQGFD